MQLVFVARFMSVSEMVGFGLSEFDILAMCLLAASLLLSGGILGWYLHAMLRDHGLELRSQAADVEWLKAALADSEKRSAQQSEWLNAMEEELTLLRNEGDSPTTPKTGPQSDEIR